MVKEKPFFRDKNILSMICMKLRRGGPIRHLAHHPRVRSSWIPPIPLVIFILALQNDRHEPSAKGMAWDDKDKYKGRGKKKKSDARMEVSLSLSKYRICLAYKQARRK